MSWVMGLSAWLQVPVILAVAAPVCAAAGYVLLRVVDGVARLASRNPQRPAQRGEFTAAEPQR